MNIIDNFLAVIAPHECLGCGSEGSLLCVSCQMSLPRLPSICFICARATKNFKPCHEHSKARSPSQAFICSSYEGLAKDLIVAYKFEHKRAGARDLANMIVYTLPYFANKPIITNVPTIGRHIRARGFDHTKLLAIEVAKKLDCQYLPLLARKDNIVQVGASQKDRKKQLKNSIYAINQSIATKNEVLLIDDVITTGATTTESSKILYKAGAQKVLVATVAKNL